MGDQFVTAPQPTLKRVADLSGPDFYPTPAWATFALIENENFIGDIWEPACGDGAMSSVLSTISDDVRSSDLYDRGFGESGIDFRVATQKCDNIITNPPFNAAQDFVEAGLRCANSKFALLLRLAFLEGVGRQHTIFKLTPPTTVWVFSERVTFYPKNVEKKGSGTTAYAWFVWDQENLGPTRLNWLPTGYKSRYN